MGKGELDWNKKIALLIEKKIHSGMYSIFFINHDFANKLKALTI